MGMLWLAAIQTDDVERQLRIAGSVLVIMGAAWAVARFVLKPLLHSWMFSVLGEEPVKLTDVVIDALDKNDRTRSAARGFGDRLYSDRLQQHQETRDKADANSDSIEFLKASVNAQGKALTQELASAVREFTRSNEEHSRQNEAQTAAMREIQRELQALREAYVRIDERMSYWDGSERRQKPR